MPSTPLKLGSYNNMLLSIVFDLKAELLSTPYHVTLYQVSFSVEVYQNGRSRKKMDYGPNNDYFYSP